MPKPPDEKFGLSGRLRGGSASEWLVVHSTTSTWSADASLIDRGRSTMQKGDTISCFAGVSSSVNMSNCWRRSIL